MKRKRTPEEWAEEQARFEAGQARLRERIEHHLEKLEAERRAEAEKPRGLRRLFSF
jgi:hypothetical protein